MDKIDEKLSKNIASILFFYIMNLMTKVLFFQNNIQMKLLCNLFFSFLAIIIFIKSIRYIAKRNLYFLIINFSILFAVVALIFLIDGEYVIAAQTQIIIFLAYCFPLYLLTYSLRSYGRLLAELYRKMYLAIFFCVAAFISQDVRSQTYETAIAYFSLYPSIILFEYAPFYSKKNRGRRVLLPQLLAIITFVFIIVRGQRGATFVLLMYFIIKFLFDKKMKTAYKFLISSFGVLVAFFYRQILLITFNLLTSVGVVSRTLYMITYEDFLYSSGRAELIKYCLDVINDSPLWGHGVMSLEKYAYSHNFLIDIVMNFGFLGLGFFLLIFINLFIKVIMSRDKIIRDFFIVFIVLGTGTVMFSNNYWNETGFWIMLGFAIASLKRRELNNG